MLREATVSRKQIQTAIRISRFFIDPPSCCFSVKSLQIMRLNWMTLTSALALLLITHSGGDFFLHESGHSGRGAMQVLPQSFRPAGHFDICGLTSTGNFR
jgi:hypothetical protein